MTILFIYPLSLFCVSNKELFLGQNKTAFSKVNFALGNSGFSIKKIALTGQSAIYIDDEISNLVI
jgi:hypothetical protein